MNTKIIFYCIDNSHNQFTKIIFETILPGNCIEDKTCAVDWVDENISKHYNQFDLDCVLKWDVLFYESTNDEPKNTEIIKTVDGHLFFEDSIDWLYYRIGKAKEETRQIKKKTRKIKKELNLKLKKDYPSVWIEPNGEVHELGFAQHEAFASDWLKDNEPEIFESKFGFNIDTKYRYSCCYEILQDLGWLRILGWKDPPDFVLPNKITVKQKQSLRNYCLNNEVPYHAFPELLKS